MRVNKSFEAITKHSAFDKVFFRTRAIKLGESIDLDQLHVNPVFRKINYSCRSEDVHFLFCDEKPGSRIGFRRLALIDSSAGHQNATEPAVTCLYLDVYGSGAEMLVESKRGVTVQTVMQALCDCRPGCNYRSHHFSFEGFYKVQRRTYPRGSMGLSDRRRLVQGAIIVYVTHQSHHLIHSHQLQAS
jgi:hypothetical protein